jgi:hypothetical protein
MTASSLCARYSDGRHLNEVEVIVSRDGSESIFSVSPANDEVIDSLRIEKPLKNKKISLKEP